MIPVDEVPAAIETELRQIRRLGLVSRIEGTTLLILVFVAVPLKHLAGSGAASAIMGPVHGMAFLAYLWTLVETVSGGGWSRSEVIRLAVVSLLPFGGFTNGRFLERKAASLRMPGPPSPQGSFDADADGRADGHRRPA